MGDEKDYTEGLRDLLAERRLEKEALFTQRYGHGQDDIARLITDDIRRQPPRGEVNIVGGRRSGKTFGSMEALRQVMEEARADLFKTKDSTISIDGTALKDVTKFDLNYVTTRSKPKDPYYIPPQHQYTHTVAMDPAFINNYYSFLYGAKPPGPSLKDLASRYFGVGMQVVQEAAEGAEAAVAELGENPCTKVFIYSERANRMYKDRMQFWLTNAFKDDILACAETNS